MFIFVLLLTMSFFSCFVTIVSQSLFSSVRSSVGLGRGLCQARGIVCGVLRLFRLEAGLKQSRSDNVPSMLDWQCFVCSVCGRVDVCV